MSLSSARPIVTRSLVNVCVCGSAPATITVNCGGMEGAAMPMSSPSTVFIMSPGAAGPAKEAAAGTGG